MKTSTSMKALVAAAVLTVSSTSSFATGVFPSSTFADGSALLGSQFTSKLNDSFVFDLGTISSSGGANSGSIMPAPTPEPETRTMLLVGLGVMIAIARRRMKTTS